MGFPGGASGKEPSCQCRRPGFDPPDQEDPLEKGIATHSSTLAWKIWQATVPGITESDTTKRTRAQGGFPTLDSSYILSSKPPYFFHSISNSPHESLQIIRLNT